MIGRPRSSPLFPSPTLFRSAKGGVCPILHEPCKNLAEDGRTFEDFFGEQLKANRARLGAVEREGAHAARDLRAARDAERSEEHTSELQSQSNLVCRLLLEKK